MNFNEFYKGKEIKEFIDSYISLDIETTGLNPVTDRITEVGAVKIENGVVVDSFSTLINPIVPIPSDISKLTGIYNEDVMNEKTFEEIASELYKFIKEGIILGQNIKFDLSFLYHSFKRCNIELNNDYVDLLTTSRKLSPELESHRLGKVAEHLGVSYAGAHRAINDALITEKCYEIYKNKKND